MKLAVVGSLWCGALQAEERLPRLDKLAEEWRVEHDATEKLQQQYKQLSSKFQSLRKKHDGLEQQIEKHQREINQAQQQKRENNNNDKKKGKPKGPSDAELDQRIREDQKAIEQLKKELAPVTKEAKETQAEGKTVENKIAQHVQHLLQWRHRWADAADIDLTEDATKHQAALPNIEMKKKGPLADAWTLSRAIAFAGNQQYEPALELLEPLRKQEVWQAKAAFFRAFLYFKQGDAAKAESELGRLVQLDNKDPHYYLFRAMIELQANNLPEAKRHLENAEKHHLPAETLKHWRGLIEKP
jgi:tetratricopeptide (TPR) repeat protein